MTRRGRGRREYPLSKKEVFSDSRRRRSSYLTLSSSIPIYGQFTQSTRPLIRLRLSPRTIPGVGYLLYCLLLLVSTAPHPCAVMTVLQDVTAAPGYETALYYWN